MMFRIGLTSFSKFSVTRVRFNHALNAINSNCGFKTNAENLANFAGQQQTSLKQLPEEADAVIIGAGSVGCSTAYHLSKLNKGNVVLLEKDKITSGTTWHSAGILWSFKGTESETLLLLQTKELISNILPSITNENAGWINTGGLHIMKNHDTYKSFMQGLSYSRAFGQQFVEMKPNEISDLHPLLNVSDVYNAIYSPGDGTIDPATYCMFLIKAARSLNAKVYENCAVTNIITKQDDLGYKRVAAVETKHGKIKTNVVINCTGAWAPTLGQMVGVRIPQLTYKHAYVVTEPIEGIQKTPIVKDHGAIYIKPQGNALNFGGYEYNPLLVSDLPDDFSFGLYDLDWNIFNPHYESAINRIPAIENVGVKSTVCGPESFTSDSKPNLGESPEVRGFFVGSAFNSGGMMLGGGAGRQLAHWAYYGKPEFDLYNCDIRRYSNKLTNFNKWLHEKCHSTFAKRYSLTYKHDQSLSGRNQRFGPLHEVHKAEGALFGSKNGFERPAYYIKDKNGVPRRDLDILPYDFYGSYGHKKHESYPYKDEVTLDCTYDFSPKSHELIGKECSACRTSCAIFDNSTMAKYHVTGDDADRVMRSVFTRDVTKSRCGQLLYSLMLNRDAGIEGDAIITKIDDNDTRFIGYSRTNPVYYVTMSSSGEKYFQSHMERVAADLKLKCKIKNKTDDVAILSIQGPKSADLLGCIVEDLSLKDLRYAEWRKTNISNLPVMIARLSFVGELGYEVHCNSDHAKQVYDALMEFSKQHNACLAGYRALESLSCEAGFHHWPHSIKSSDNPVSSGLMQFCDDTTLFVGSDALRRLRDEPLHKRLIFFTVKCDVPLYGDEVILKDGDVVGFLRNAAFAYSLDCNIACGYVTSSVELDQETIMSGNYMIERMGIKYPAEVHLKSPFKNKLK